MKLFAEITKVDRERRMVFGYASTEALDSQGEVVRKEAIEAALPDYMRFANIREMHQPSAIGVAKEAAIDDKGLYLAARIVDDEAWRKVTEGVYKGFSIGGRVTDRDRAQKHVITGVELMEISLVDRPANPEAVIELYKAALRPPQQIWDCGSAGHRHLVKAEAVRCIEQAGASALAARAAPPSPPAGAALALRKGMAGVQSFAGILAEIDRLCSAAAAEAASEGDDSAMPARLKAWLDAGAKLMRAMVAEETGELTAPDDDEEVVDDGAMAPVQPALPSVKAALDGALDLLAKVGARHSRADLERVQKLHDTSVELGADCPAAAKRAATADPLLLRQVADLTKRLAIIEAQPMPAKGVTKLVAVGKEQDAGGAGAMAETVDAFVARLAAMAPDKRSHELTKLALRLPQRLPR
jgi:HK97 family phage prohead protease